jgi:serine/threonine-protein kinase
MAESPVELGSVVAGRYRIDRALGAGTMGVVVAAWHLELEQAVAIKFLNPAVLGASEALERFRREARAAASIKSEHVVRVLDVGAMPDGLPFIVMELLRGRSLEDELLARGPLPASDAIDYVLQAIDALSEAHAAGIVHRDLKPANLFVAERPDRSSLVKVLDFGISKVTGDAMGMGLTRTGMIVGSPLYMAPEQLRSTKSVDQRADVWALGTILFQLLTARTPYNADSAPDLYAMLLRDPPTPITLFRSDLPDGLEGVIMRCLERDPERRFQDVGELADALLPLAPPHSRIHADRARRVLLGASQRSGASQGSDATQGSDVSHRVSQPPVMSVGSEPRSGSRPGAQDVRASTGGGGPLIVTNRKTLRSGGETQARSIPWLPLSAAAVLALGVGGYFFAQRGGVTSEVDAAQAQGVSPAAMPAAMPAPVVDAVVAPEAPSGSAPLVSVVPAGAASGSANAPSTANAPGVNTARAANAASVTPAASEHVVQQPTPVAARAPAAAIAPGRATVVAAKPVASVAATASAAPASAAPQPSIRALSNFGGRK